MRAFLVIDLQNDFCPGGALAVQEGDRVVPLINRLQENFDLVVATQDWHPRDHLSFAGNHPGKKPGDEIELDGLRQILWPDHCVQNTTGAALVATLDTKKIARVFQKGTDRRIDSYSGFFDNGHKKSTGLGEYLKTIGVDEVCIAGLATDYCVKYSALDAVGLGFRVTVIADACRGVNLAPGAAESALAEMARAGARVVSGRDAR